MKNKTRALAFYLPQYHPFQENDTWWGKGFTEWTNVAKAKPLYRGHYQPHLPADLGFYDLRVPDTRQAQADMAKKYGIEGFCYYHYWFAGKRMLHLPFQEVLSSGKPDFPFCLCWANHSWNSIWVGAPDRILVEQTYPGIKDHENHFNFLLKAFSDTRYITVHEKPIFFIYNPDQIPEINKVADMWREMALKAGLKGLHLVGISHANPSWDPRERGLDGCMMQKLPPINGRIPLKYWDAKLKLLMGRKKQSLTIYEYEEMIGFLLRKKKVEFLDYPCVLPNWDNTPRAGMSGLVFQNSTPELFRIHLKQALARIEDYDPENRIIMLKAWNEWAEGNRLEPEKKFGTGYLEVLMSEINPSGET